MPKIFWILKHEYFWNICKSCIILIEKACKYLPRHYCSLTALQIHDHKRQIIPVYFIYIFSEIEMRLMLRDKLFTIFVRISSKTIYLNMNMELSLFEVSIYQSRLHSSLEMTRRGWNRRCPERLLNFQVVNLIWNRRCPERLLNSNLSGYRFRQWRQLFASNLVLR